MGPTDEEQFAAAETLWASGRVKAAAAAHVDLSRKAAQSSLERGSHSGSVFDWSGNSDETR
ncbi:MAG: hypothetical protein DMG38_00440 [Acidobacteria bacterium]|nr:MAG: hypothetical protein DMG38_00440 [Acidobacteriota bacterium]